MVNLIVDILVGKNEETFTCQHSGLIPPCVAAVNSDLKSERLGLEKRQVLENNQIACSLSKDRDLDDMSSELNSDQERTLLELGDFLEDSDCSVKDKDYVPDASTLETSDEESHGGKFLKFPVKL